MPTKKECLKSQEAIDCNVAGKIFLCDEAGNGKCMTKEEKAKRDDALRGVVEEPWMTKCKQTGGVIWKNSHGVPMRCDLPNNCGGSRNDYSCPKGDCTETKASVEKRVKECTDKGGTWKPNSQGSCTCETEESKKKDAEEANEAAKCKKEYDACKSKGGCPTEHEGVVEGCYDCKSKKATKACAKKCGGTPKWSIYDGSCDCEGDSSPGCA